MTTAKISEHQPAVAHSLQPTTLAGCFYTPATSGQVDMQTADANTLARNGYYWTRPKDGDNPVLFDVWNKHFNAPLSTEGRIVPALVVREGKSHRPIRKTRAGRVANEITNWSGGVLGGTWNSAVGTWTVPAVSKPAEGPGVDGGWDSSSWVGLDGSGSNDVLQAGVEQSVDKNGNASYVAWYEWYCNYQKRVLGDTSPLSPSLASLNGRLYIAWRGDGNTHLNVMVSTDDGQTFHSKLVSPEASDDAPALATDGARLYIAWKGAGNPKLNVAQVALDASGAPVTLQGKVVLGDTSPVRPTLAVLNGALYLGWKGNGNDNLNVMVSTDQGRSFGHKYVSNETSPHAPGLCAHAGNLFITWKGDGNDHLNVARVGLSGTAPGPFSGKVILGDTSPLSPALASFNGVLYLAWRGDGNSNLNLMSSTNGGASFGGKYISPETSTDSPTITAHNGHLFYGWKGNGNDNLNVSLVGIDHNASITGFTTPAYLWEVQISNFAVKPGDQVFCSVQYLSNNTAGLITFANRTSGKNFQITLVPPPGAAVSGNTAEWIMEVPGIDGQLAHLPKFGNVPFTGALATGVSGATGNPQNGTTLAILDDGGHAETATTLGNAAVTISYI